MRNIGERSLGDKIQPAFVLGKHRPVSIALSARATVAIRWVGPAFKFCQMLHMVLGSCFCVE